jgi:hypothetical protein
MSLGSGIRDPGSGSATLLCKKGDEITPFDGSLLINLKNFSISCLLIGAVTSKRVISSPFLHKSIFFFNALR